MSDLARPSARKTSRFCLPLRSISGASYQSMAQPAPSSPASPDGTADDGAFCGGTGSSDGRHTADILVLSSTNSRLPAYARLPPPICALTRPRCTRCELLVSLGSAGLACVLLAGALLLAACWCARRRDAASRFASCSAEAAVAALRVASGSAALGIPYCLLRRTRQLLGCSTHLIVARFPRGAVVRHRLRVPNALVHWCIGALVHA